MHFQLPPIVSIGRACGLIQATPQSIQRAARELGIEPCTRINCIDHFSEVDLEKIQQHLRQQEVTK